jgi:hypothetical protein
MHSLSRVAPIESHAPFAVDVGRFPQLAHAAVGARRPADALSGSLSIGAYGLPLEHGLGVIDIWISTRVRVVPAA